MIRPCHELVLLKPRPDVHADLFGLGASVVVDVHGRALRLGSPISYRINGKRDQFAIAEVVGMGKGTPYGSGSSMPDVNPGQFVGLDCGQVGHALPNGLWTVPGKMLTCRVSTTGELMPEPLSDWVMTCQDELAMRRLVFSGQSTLHVPGQTRAKGIATGDTRKTQVKLCAERVMAAGPGRFIKKAFVEADCRPGDIACFRAGGALHLNWTNGALLTFVRWGDIELVIDGS